MMESNNNIRVVCRFRPQNKKEINEGGFTTTVFDDDKRTVTIEGREKQQFTFDRVFDWNTSQDVMFEYTASATINDVMKGYNGTIFAYGQTGSGKTHTMMGDMENVTMRGITPNLVEKIFDTILKAPDTLEFTVRVSFMEIYMEKIKDLLFPQNDNLPVHEEKSKGVYVKGLLEVFVSSTSEVFEAMRKGQENRVTAATNMNAESSRSHSIFVIQISQKNLLDGSTRVGKLYLVDLAGSEKIGKTGATGQTLEEAKKINKSLSALGMVINSLTDGKSSHIPYRDSKLTRILQESLGGNSRTTLIINCSPCSSNEAETISTLRFGMRAKTIKNKAKVNADLSPAELKNMLKKIKQDLSALQMYTGSLESELSIWRSGASVAEADRVVFNSNNYSTENLSTSSPIRGSFDMLPLRSQTPITAWTNDDREEFFKRENELADQLEEAESDLKNKIAVIQICNEEINFLKEKEISYVKEKNQLHFAINDLKSEIDNLNFENKDNQIMMDSLTEANNELANEINTLRKKLHDFENKPAENFVKGEVEKRKKEKIAELMGDLNDSNSTVQKIKETLKRLSFESNLNNAPTLPRTEKEIIQQHKELLESKNHVKQQGVLITELVQQIRLAREEYNKISLKKDGVEFKLSGMHTEYESLLNGILKEKNNIDEDKVSNEIEELTLQLEKQYLEKKNIQEEHFLELKNNSSKKDDDLIKFSNNLLNLTNDNAELKKSLEQLKKASSSTALDLQKKEQEFDQMRKNMTQQMLEFDAMKKKLMIDLQNRCEKIVELEISLDENRELVQINKNNSQISKSQQQKMIFLEQNLEQLTAVQKQLVEQNTSLKKEFAIAERKLSNRNDRIIKLESLFQDAQTKLELQSQKFDAQLSSMREKLKEAKTQNGVSQNGWLYAGRIAKPLRGGGGGAGGISGSELDEKNDNLDVVNYMEVDNNAINLPNPTASATLNKTPPGKRSNWYVSLLKK